MTGKSASPEEALEPKPVKQIRSPRDIPHQPVNELVRQWSEALGRTVLAKHTNISAMRVEDLFAELAYGARIARETTSGRWCVAADLLRLGAAESWAQLGTAMDLTETEARDGFLAWIAGQVHLRQTSTTLGITQVEAEELHALAEAVTW